MGFFSDMLGGEARFEEPKLSQEARKQLYRLGNAQETQPVQQVAGADPLMQQTYGLTQGMLAQGLSPGYNTSMNFLTNKMTQPIDVTTMPGFQGVWDKILQEGGLSSRNLQRALKLSGNAATNTSKGRDIMGRQQSEVEGKQASAEQMQAATALPNVAGQQQNAALANIQAGTQQGQMMQAIQQAIANAQYQAGMNDLSFRYSTQPGLLQSTLVNPQMTQSQGWLGGLTNMFSGLNNLGGAALGVTQGVGPTLSSIGNSLGSLFTPKNPSAQTWGDVQAQVSGPYG
jgi:hypothetical protein